VKIEVKAGKDRQSEFQKVQKVMRFLDWRWQLAETSPSIAELKETARAMLESMVKDLGNDFCHSSCGGFHVEYDEKGKRLDLYFCIEETLCGI